MSTAFKPNPYGVLPLGCSGVRSTGRFGAFIDGKLDVDGIIMAEILPFLSIEEVCRLARVSSAWYVATNWPDTWRQRCGDDTRLTPKESGLRFRINWKTTAVRAHCIHLKRTHTPENEKKAFAIAAAGEYFVHTPFAPTRRFYHDALFQSWMCTGFDPAFGMDPTMLLPDDNGNTTKKKQKRGLSGPRFKSVPEHTLEELDQAEFRRRYEEPNLPVVLKGAAKDWPIFTALQSSIENLPKLTAEKDRLFRCENFEMSLAEFANYAQTQTEDERPVYLFDADFTEKLSSSKQEPLYTVPPHFGIDDLFGTLGESRRPNYRWLIAGPKRSGSSFHVDPNFTSAWNACLTGRKRWMFFPPHIVPPGVIPSPDMSTVATPVSLGEWLLNHHAQTLETLSKQGYECICEPGDIAFVPCGWWHSVINLEPSVAVTQNFVSQCNLQKVLKFLRAMPNSVSGLGEDEVVENESSNPTTESITFESSTTPQPLTRTRAVDDGPHLGGGGRLAHHSNSANAAQSMTSSVCPNGVDCSERARAVTKRRKNLHIDLVRAIREHRKDLQPILDAAAKEADQRAQAAASRKRNREAALEAWSGVVEKKKKSARKESANTAAAPSASAESNSAAGPSSGFMFSF